MKPGELWVTIGLWKHEREAPATVRIMEILPSGNVDVNYQLDETKEPDMRILPANTMLRRVEVRP